MRRTDELIRLLGLPAPPESKGPHHWCRGLGGQTICCHQLAIVLYCSRVQHTAPWMHKRVGYP